MPVHGTRREAAGLERVCDLPQIQRGLGAANGRADVDDGDAQSLVRETIVLIRKCSRSAIAEERTLSSSLRQRPTRPARRSMFS